MERRKFLGKLGVAVGTPLAAGVLAKPGEALPAADPDTPVSYQPPADTIRGSLRFRKMGNTGEEISIIGLGGYHMAVPKEEKDSIQIVRCAIDAGINFMDNCWDYHDGLSEERMGQALRDGYRRQVFLMTKIDGRTRESAARQIDQCLQRLQTDCIDLMQVHEVIRLEDPDRILAPGGTMEAVLAAKKAGKIRYIGFTGHKDPFVLLRMLEMAAQHKVRFDTVQMPLNVLDAHFRSFEKQVLPVLVKEKMGVLGMKPLACGHILKSKVATPMECLHYAMTLPTSTVITGIDSMAILKQALKAVETFRPLTQAQMATLRRRTATAAAEGKFELFKTTAQYDGTAIHPEWMG
jgi:aryl-alcohol dehydrogenase-like predicted oxidoreductase